MALLSVDLADCVGLFARREDVVMPWGYSEVLTRDIFNVARRGDLTIPMVATDFGIAAESVRGCVRQVDMNEGTKDSMTRAEQSESVRLR